MWAAPESVVGQAEPSAAPASPRDPQHRMSGGGGGGTGPPTPCPTTGGGPAQQLNLKPAHSTQLEKAKWLHDLNTAIDAAKTGSTLAPAPPARTLRPLPHGECWLSSWRPRWLSGGGTGGHRASPLAMPMCPPSMGQVRGAAGMGALAGQCVGVLPACRWPERLCPQPGPASPQGPRTRPPWSQSLRTRLAGPRAPWREWASAVPTPPCMCAGAATLACPGPTTARLSRYARAPLLCSLPTAAPSWPPHPSACSLAYQARGRALRADGGQAGERAGGGQLMGTYRTGGDLGAPLQSVPAPGSEARSPGLRGNPCCPWAQAWGHACDAQRGMGHQRAAQGPCKTAHRLQAERGAARVGATVGLSPRLSRGTGDKQSWAWPAFPCSLDR